MGFLENIAPNRRGEAGMIPEWQIWKAYDWTEAVLLAAVNGGNRETRQIVFPAVPFRRHI